MKGKVIKGVVAGLVFVVVLSLVMVVGCGGGRNPSQPVTPPSNPTQEISSNRSVATARFYVDVKTRQVIVTPVSGQVWTTKGRIVLTGTAVNFVSSILLDHPGNPGIKVIRVSLVNRWNLPIGQLPDGTVTGIRVLFSSITGVSAFSDIRPNVTVTTFAGAGSAGATDGHVNMATFNQPSGVALDPLGNIYVTDYGGHRIRKIQGNFVSTLAGSGSAGYANGIGTAASFNGPFGIAYNPVDNSLVVTELLGHRVRRVTLDGRVTLIAGTGVAGDADGSGDVAQFRQPSGVAVDNNGVIYVSEALGHRIRKIVLTGSDPTNPSHYTVSTFVGSPTAAAGFADGIGTAARFNAPRSLTIAPDGTLYVADENNRRIRRVSPTGEVITIAGTGVVGIVDGPGDTARFQIPYGIVWVNGALIVSESSGAHVLRQVRLREPNAAEGRASNWLVQTLAGSAGTSGSADGSGVDARFNVPRLLAVDSGGSIYVADSYNHRIRRVIPTSGFFPIGVTTGTTSPEPVQLANADGVIPSSDFGSNLPFIVYNEVLTSGATSKPKEWWFIVPEGVSAFEFTVRVETETQGLVPPSSSSGLGSPLSLVRTFAGFAGYTGFADGVASQARFNGILGVAVDTMGNVYVADSTNHAIRRISPLGIVSTIVGNVGAPQSGDVDGLGSNARLNTPTGLAVTPDGAVIYVADSGNHKIKRITIVPWADPTNPDNWAISTIAGTGTAGKDDGAGNLATFNRPYGVAVDSWGNVYVTELAGNRVRRLQFRGGDPNLATNWQVSLVAGDNSAAAGASGNTDGIGSAARFNSPCGITVDRAGNLYVADSGNHRIRKIVNALGSSGGTVSTLAGSTQGYADGLGTSAQFNNPRGVSVDTANNLYVADTGNHRIRRVSSSGVVTTIAGTGTTGNIDGIGNIAQFNTPTALVVDGSGKLYVVDGANGEIVRLIQRIINANSP